MCHALDRKTPSLDALRKYLLGEGCEPMLPIEAEDETKSLQIHSENLGLCDACLIFYGNGSPEWFEAKVRDLRKYLRGRQPPVTAKAIYIASPSNEHKNELETLEAMVLRAGETFSPAVVAPFVQKVCASPLSV